MRRKFRVILSLFFALVCTVCLAAALTACNTHEHTWSESWTTDSDYHWHAPNCDDTDEVKDKAAHVDANQDGKCDVCKYDVGHEHTFADGWTSDETHHWHEATCSHTNEKGSYAEHEDLDEDGECDTCHKAVEHKHRYAKEWSTDKDNHWHEAICSHQTEKSEFGPHIDEDQNGYCDVCDYEIGHEHSYEEKWTTSETQHWHAATCTHQNMKSELGNHEFDENGDCRTCHYHKHVFSEEWTVDISKHWHVATCEDGGDEKSNEEAHDFGFSDKCKCGVEKQEINVYNIYYRPEQEFLGEEPKDFGAWHTELVKAGVKHVEMDVLTQDVVYTYDNPDGEDITVVKYGSSRTINVKVAKGKVLEEDERGLPDVTFKVIAKINGEPVANGKALATCKINRVSGEGEITFMPYFGYSGTNRDGQKIEYAITLAAEGDKDYVEITNAYVFTSTTERSFTVNGDTHAETFTGNFNMERALGTGELGEIKRIDFGQFSGGLAGSLETSSYYLNLPAGWYMLSYISGHTINNYHDGYYFVSATVDGDSYDNDSTYVPLYYGKGEEAHDGIIYIPEGAKRICFESRGAASRVGTARLEPYEFPGLKADGSKNIILSSYTRSSNIPYNWGSIRLDYKLDSLTPGAYDFYLPLASNVSVSMYLNGQRLDGSYGHYRLIIDEDDEIGFMHSATGGSVRFLELNINKIETAEKDKDFKITFESGHNQESRVFTAPQAGLYAISVTSESDLKDVTIGKDQSNGNIVDKLIGQERKEIKGEVYLQKDEIVIFNFYNGGGNFPEITCKVVDAELPTAFTLGESASIKIGMNEMLYRSFTAKEDGFYTLSATSTSNIRYFTAGIDGSTDNLISNISVNVTRYAASNVFYAKKDVPVIFTLVTVSSSGALTVDCKIEAVKFTSAELNQATDIEFSKDKISAAYTFTATEAGDYGLTVTSATKLEGLRVVSVGEEITELLNLPITSSSSSTKFKTIKLTLEKSEKVELLFLYNLTTNATTISFTINHSEPTALTANEEETLTFCKDLYTKTYTFTATDAGKYMFVLSATSLNYVDVLNGEGESLFSGATKNLTFNNLIIELEKDAKLTLVFNYNTALTTGEKEIKLTLSKIVSEDLTVNVTKDVALGNGTIFKSFNFTATDEAYYSLVLSSETSLKDIKIIDETGANIVAKITSSTTKFSLNAYKLTAGQKINFLIVNEGSAEVSLKFRVEYDTPKALTVNKDSAITFSEENNAEYYSFTATEAAYYTLVLTSDTDLKNVQVYNAATNGSVGSPSATSTSKYYLKTFKLTAGEKINFLVKYNTNASYPTINVRVEYDTPTAMTANEDRTIEFSKENLVQYFTFTATEAGVYMRVLTTETDLKNLQIINAETGEDILKKVSATKKYDVTRFSMTAGEKLSFLVYYNITTEPTAFPTIDFRIEYRNATELTVNTDTEVKFTEEQNAVYLSFTATEENYYTLVLNADTAVKGVSIYNAKTNVNYGTVNNAKFFSYNKLKLAAKEQVTFLIYFEGSENYPTFKFRVEYDTPKELTVNTAEKITFSKTNNAEYYSFTATDEAAYALVLTSQTSLKNVSIVNLANGNDLLPAITTAADKSKVVLSSTTVLKADGKLNFMVLYKGSESHPSVELKVAYKTPTEMALNKDMTVSFVAGKNVEYLSFTATQEGQYALEISSETSLKNVQVYNGMTGASIIDKITKDDKASVLVSSVTKFAKDGKLVLAVVYDGVESYPAVKVKMVKEAAETLKMDANTITFAAGTHVKTLSFSSEEDTTVSFKFSSDSGLNNVKVYDGTTGSPITLGDNNSFAQEITAGTPYEMIVTYTGSTELKLAINVGGMLSAPKNFNVEGCNLLTWNEVPGATKYKVTWAGRDTGFMQGSTGSAETNKLYYNITSTMTTDNKGYTYTVIAVDESGKSGDSPAAVVMTSKSPNWYNYKIKVTVEVPEGFPEALRLLKLQTSTNNFAGINTAGIIEVSGHNSYVFDSLLISNNRSHIYSLRIDPTTLPEGYTCEVIEQIAGASNYEKTLKITKTA